jgi:dienelactone hydrolase
VKFLKRALLLVAILAGVLALAWKLTEPAPLPPGSAGAALLAQPPWGAGMREFELVDSSRPTGANGDFPGAPERRLRARAWYPLDADGRSIPARAFPLIIYSHGFFSTSAEPAYLARYLASHGYVVVAADFPLTTMKAPGGANVFDVVNQPGDVSFLIDTLLAWNGDPANAFHQRIDAARIGIAGTSLGGMTTELTAYHPRLRDPRVKAAVSIAGPLQLFGRAFFADSALPFMMVAGDIDAMVPYEQNARPVLERVNNAWLVSLAGASHTGFADQGSVFRWMANPDSVGCFFVRGRTPEAGDDTSFYDRLGSVEEGVLRGMEDSLCRMDPLPDAMSPLLQQRITMLAVRSFFESVFNPDASQQARYRDYLQAGLARDFPAVTVERSTPSG